MSPASVEMIRQMGTTPKRVEELYQSHGLTPNLELLVKDTNHSKAIRALGAGYRSFANYASKYPFLGYRDKKEIALSGLIVENDNGTAIIHPLSNALDIGLTGIQENVDNAETTGLFDAIMIASYDMGPFNRKEHFSRNFAVVGFISINGQPIRFGQHLYRTVSPDYIVPGGMGFLIQQSNTPTFELQRKSSTRSL